MFLLLDPGVLNVLLLVFVTYAFRCSHRIRENPSFQSSLMSFPVQSATGSLTSKRPSSRIGRIQSPAVPFFKIGSLVSIHDNQCEVDCVVVVGVCFLVVVVDAKRRETTA